MNTTFFIILGAIMLYDGLLMTWLSWAATSSSLKKYRIRTPKTYQIPALRKHINTTLNNLMSLGLFLGFLYFFGDQALYSGWPGAAHLLGESLAVLLLYDFLYYFYHRGMHHRLVLKYVHRVHHMVRFPTANESIFLHPLEAIGAIILLCGSVLLFGPISSTSFLVVFFVYSTVNILVHSNLDIPHPAFRLLNFWARAHDVHHAKLKYNYSSIFPFWDQAFGTFK